MKIPITGTCGFVGSAIAEAVRRRAWLPVTGIDNLMRPGSESNRLSLRDLGVTVVHGDIRSVRDFADLPAADWVISAAANSSVSAGLRGTFSWSSPKCMAPGCCY
jgi:CDP-paratose 2-epimerase